VIAIRGIPRDTNPFIEPVKPKWILLSPSDLANLDPAVRQMVYDFYATEKDSCVDISEFALNGMNISYFLNESEKPNLRRLRNGEFKTTRKIRKGEELFTRYSDFDHRYR
jgi:hypothetical protein